LGFSFRLGLLDVAQNGGFKLLVLNHKYRGASRPPKSMSQTGSGHLGLRHSADPVVLVFLR
jgi:hypothetical protein